MTGFSINSIYAATEGEGIHIGTPQVFVRFQGCSIGCLNCDSKETWDFNPNYESLQEVLAEVEAESTKYAHRVKRVSITGGDPLHPKHEKQVLLLAGELKKKGYFLNLEAAGSRIVDGIFDVVNFVSFDVKTPSTGVKTNPKLIEKVCRQYIGKAQIKSVIADKKDFEFVYDQYLKLEQVLGDTIEIPWVLTPCYEPHEEFPRDRFIDILNWNQEFGSVFKVIGQQHKWIFGPSKKNV